ncbi:hypothetical protein BV25DRAFT_1813205 [Artomyces pyxidatus]|uniref:Uncharacterized protein n=1 Tax=Artomyces pyxidatus TaxID=48021 RepID=A0ACB8SLU9_9AGAM|nr:hypothetical protein BV25DRAFT_1813205 [Artomyces pyxidatus]
MQTASYVVPPRPPTQTHSDPLRSSLGHLLSSAHTLPCSTAAQAFQQLVQPTARFQLALDALLPLLDSSRSQLSQRILVSYILYSLYAPHPVAINPFKSVLYDTFIKERNNALQLASTGGTSENEQLVWVLWKILRGDGNDIGPYTPSTLARHPLPPKLRATNLYLEEESQAEKASFDPFGDEEPSDNAKSQQASRAPSRSDWSRSGTSGLPAAGIDQNSPIAPEEDERTHAFSQGMTLLLAARERVLTLSEQRTLGPLITQLISPSILTSADLAPIIAHNPTLAHPLLVSLLSLPPSKGNPVGASIYLDILAQLPPTLPSFDVLGRLLRDATPMTDYLTGGKLTIADVVRTEVLGRFIQQSIHWLDYAEREERQGLVSEDRFAKGVQNLCRFYTSLLKLEIVDAASDTDSAEMAHFALRNSRFEEANALYRVLAVGKL